VADKLDDGAADGLGNALSSGPATGLDEMLGVKFAEGLTLGLGDMLGKSVGSIVEPGLGDEILIRDDNELGGAASRLIHRYLESVGSASLTQISVALQHGRQSTTPLPVAPWHSWPVTQQSAPLPNVLRAIA
jgi:hypothetical protein